MKMQKEVVLSLILWMFLFAAGPNARAGRIICVDADAPAGGDGANWATAFKYLQDALTVADANDEIRVAQGLYVPDRSSADPNGTGDREATFALITDVAIRGGYAGYGTSDPNARDIRQYETILSGDLNGDDGPDFLNNTENSYHVVTGRQFDSNLVLDGFSITGGKAEGDWHRGCGGGMHNFHCKSRVIDCKFVGNSAADKGGGMYNDESTVTVTGCTLSENHAGTNGGGMYSHHRGSVVTNCIITDNFAASDGGGIASDNLFLGDLRMTNCIVAGNEAGEHGGGVFGYSCCSIRLANCILWDNIAFEGPQIGLIRDVVAFVDHCCLQGGALDVFAERDSGVDWGAGNIDADPCFVDAATGDYHLKSQAGRWDSDEGRWTIDEVTSPCIDMGDPNSDSTAELWPHGKRVNIGAFGGTPEASMSSSTLGNIADVDRNDRVDYIDMQLLVNKWLMHLTLLPEDLNQDSIVNFRDISKFLEEWLWEEL